MEPDRRDWIAFHAGHRPDQLALADTEGRIGYSYAALDRRIGKVAAALAAEPGVAPGTGARLVVLAANTPETLVLLYACERIGAVLCPLNLRLTEGELRELVDFLQPALVFHDAARTELAAELVPGEALRELGPDYGAGMDGWAGRPGPETALSMILFTSGTTSRPKAVMLTPRMHRVNAINMALSAGIDATSRHLSTMPMYHAAGFNLYAQPVLFMGGTVHVAPGFEAGSVLRWLSAPVPEAPGAAQGQRITHFFAVPSAYRLMAEHPGLSTADFGGLQVAGVGGAPLPLDLFDRFRAAGVTLLQGHGMTECGPSLFAMDPVHAPERPGSVGRPVLHAEALILRADGTAAGADEQGDLVVRGEALTPGYWRNPEATAALFRDGWLVTGDIARRDADGFYYIDGRRSQMILSGGENIAPAEIESVLCCHPEVEEGVVLGVPHELWGEVGHAFVVPRPGANPDPKALLAFCRGWLAGFKVPHGLTILDALPRNDMGKVDRRLLPNLLAGTGNGPSETAVQGRAAACDTNAREPDRASTSGTDEGV